jgi:transposase/IS5 family transposase
MAHITGSSRYQSTLFPEVPDDMVAGHHPVRVIDAFVDSLDLERLGFTKVEAEATGRPPYQPGDLLKLYIYGYLNQVRSSRRLAREAERNLEVLWLINRVMPCFKTIAEFRKVHAKSIVGVCRAFMAFCRGQELLGGELVAIDGTKIGAVASRKQVITPEKLAKQAAALDRKIAEHLAAMDTLDQEENAAPAREPAMDVAKVLAALKERRAEVQHQAETLARDEIKQLVLGEPEAKLMLTANYGHQVAYNAQSAVDAKHKLIAAFELTNAGNDTQQLHPMAQKAKEALAVESLTVVADTGYSNGEQAERCAGSQITAIVPRREISNSGGQQYFTRDRFAYDATSDTYQCPAGQRLNLESVTAEGKKSYANASACRDCPLRPQCTKGNHRRVTRTRHEEAIEAMHRRAMSDPQWMRKRRELAEHPFGTIKAMMGYPRFLLRGLVKAKAELALSVLCYNLKRTLSILGVPELLSRLRALPA